MMHSNGLSSGMSPSDFEPRALRKGAKVEMEHTRDPRVAERIAMDHLSEDSRYYDKLEKMESGGMLFPTGYKGTLLRAGVYGVFGWMLENTLWGPRYSSLFGGIAVPFLPVYAIGGLVAEASASRLKEAGLPWWGRALAYGAGLSAIEYAGCRIDRGVLGGCAWDYTGNRCLEPARGCVDLKHAIAWGMLGLAVEKLQGM